jgi:hypothetical protein
MVTKKEGGLPDSEGFCRKFFNWQSLLSWP